MCADPLNMCPDPLSRYYLPVRCDGFREALPLGCAAERAPGKGRTDEDHSQSRPIARPPQEQHRRGPQGPRSRRHPARLVRLGRAFAGKYYRDVFGPRERRDQDSGDRSLRKHRIGRNPRTSLTIPSRRCAVNEHRLLLTVATQFEREPEELDRLDLLRDPVNAAE